MIGKPLRFFDSTLRDGSHAVKHTLTAETIADYCRLVDEAGLDVVIVGHGNGLGASSLQTGLSLLSDSEMLKTARANLKKTNLGAFLIPGYGTINDDLAPAIEEGLDVVCIGTNCTEADVSRQHIGYVRSRGLQVYGVLMMYHMTETHTLVEQALLMQEYGANGVIVMDSAGASTPRMVANTMQALCSALSVDLGFHAHNNLGLAVGNAFLAYDNGANIMDATICGFGAGAGNCQLEALAAAMQKDGIETKLDLFRLLDAGEKVIAPISPRENFQTAVSIVSGLSGVFSSFASHVNHAAKQFGLDPKEIFIELGNRKVVGGQEDMVVDVAMNLAQKHKTDITSDMIASLL